MMTMDDPSAGQPSSGERLSLNDAIERALEEARMILPGVQALFGFQLIAVFNPGFSTMAGPLQLAHLGATVAVAFAIALLMTPAAYHRQRHRRHVSDHLLELTSRLISWGLLPLAVGLVTDLGLVAFVITASAVASAVIMGLVAAGLAWFWIGLALLDKARHAARQPKDPA